MFTLPTWATRPQQTIVPKSLPWRLPIGDGVVIEQALPAHRLRPGMILNGEVIDSVERRTETDGVIVTLLDGASTTVVLADRVEVIVGLRIEWTTATSVRDDDVLVRIVNDETLVQSVRTAVRLDPPITSEAGTLILLRSGERVFVHHGAGVMVVCRDRDPEATESCEECGHSAFEHLDGQPYAPCEVDNCPCGSWSPGDNRY